MNVDKTPPYSRRRTDKPLWRIAVGLLAAWAIVATFGIVSYGIITIQDHRALNRSSSALERSNAALARADRNTATIENNILHSCVRLNIVRAEDNKSHYGDYLVISQQLKFQSSSLKSNYAALKHIGVPIAVLNRALKQQLASLQTARIQADSKSWVPLTNCTAVALSSGGTYKPPQPIPFSQGKPPASSMDFRNAALNNPVGSLP